MRLDQGNDSTNSLLTAAGLRLGVHSGTLYKYITGMGYPSLSTVRKIEEEFHWPVDAQIRLFPLEVGTVDLGYGMVLAEVLREHFPDIEPGFSGTGRTEEQQPRYRPSVGGWTHSLVAKRLSCRVNNVTRWVTGIRYPETRTILRIARVFNWPAPEQIALIPEDGYNDDWATAFRAVLDREFPLKTDVTKITSEKV